MTKFIFIFFLLQASIRQDACYYDVECTLGVNLTDPNLLASMSEAERAEFEQMLILKAMSNTEAIRV